MGKRRSKKEDVYTSYSEETIKKKRKFPKPNTVLITFIIIAQIALICFAVIYQPKPQDIIDNYDITVTPNADGSLDMEYSFKWTALDSALTWATIGMANSNFEIIEDSWSDNIMFIHKDCDEYGYSGVEISFDWFDGLTLDEETLEFSFKIRQYNMLCSDDDGMFYEFVPGWFNSIPVKNYTFRWKDTGVASANNDTTENGYKVWKGELNSGEYAKIDVRYPQNYFKNASVVHYEPFSGSGAYNELAEGKAIVILICVFLILVGVFAEVVIVDGFVSYNRGRGFITGYGYPYHTYGFVNPRCRTARDAHNASIHSSGYHGGGGGGCACACACACAGGGRAGCSQKDTYKNTREN